MQKFTLIGLVMLICASCSSTPSTTPTNAIHSPNSKPENPAMTIYTRGQSAVDSGDYDEALAQFTRLRKQYQKTKAHHKLC